MHIGQPVYYLARFSYVYISINAHGCLTGRSRDGSLFAIAEIVNQNAKPRRNHSDDNGKSRGLTLNTIHLYLGIISVTTKNEELMIFIV